MSIKDALIKRLSLSNDEHASLSYANFKRGKATTLLAISFYLLFFYQLINSTLRFSPQKLFYIDVTFFVCLPLIMFFLLYRIDKVFFVNILNQLKPPPKNRVLTLVLIAVLLGLISSLLFDYLDSLFKVASANVSQANIHSNKISFLKRAGQATYLATTAAFVEELFYKPLFFYLAASRFRITQKQAIFISAFLFTLVHFEQGRVSLMIIGFCYALPTTYFYAKTRNIFALVILHFTQDFITFIRSI